MRLLHTSDWHLGRSLYSESMLPHQRRFLRWLVDTAVAQQVDAVLVAGDVYDRAVPPPDAVTLLDDVLSDLAVAGVDVVITSGNHDSPVRLGFGARLARRAGVHLRTDLGALTDPVVLDDLAVYGIPYLLPDAVLAELAAERSHTSVLRAAVDRIRSDAADRGVHKIVVMAHAFVTGAAGSESERDIRVGGIGDVPASVFDGLTYVALGHLHGAQQVTPTMRYCGSPLPFSFSERFHHKSVSLVDVADDGAVTVQTIPTPVARPMAEIRGRLDDLLTSAGGPDRDVWVRAVLTDPGRPSASMERLRERWPHTLVVEHVPDRAAVTAADDLPALRQQTDPVEVCAMFVEWVESTLPSAQQHDVLVRAVEAAVTEQPA